MSAPDTSTSTARWALLAVLAAISCSRAQEDGCDPRASNRKDCGFDGVTKESCEAQYCCWAPVLPNPNNVPWCFYPLQMDSEVEVDFAGSSSSPGDADKHFELGRGYLHGRGRDLGKAYEALEEAIKINPLHANAIYHLGILHQKRERYPYAIMAYQHALSVEKDPEQMGLYLAGMAKAFSQQNNWHDAQQAYKEAIQVRPFDASIYSSMGEDLKERDGQLSKANRAFSNAISLDPSDARAYLNNAEVLSKLKREKAAIEMYEQGLALAENQTTNKTLAKLQGYMDLGDLYANQRMHEKALQALTEAFQIQPNNEGVVLKLTNLFHEGEQLVQESYFQAQVYSSVYGLLKKDVEVEVGKILNIFLHTCNDKLAHDIAQLQELLMRSSRQGQAKGQMQTWIEDQIVPSLQAILVENAEIPGGNQYEYRLTAENLESVMTFYNRAVYTPTLPVPPGTKLLDAKALPAGIEDTFAREKFIAIPGLMAHECVLRLLSFFHEATIWHEFRDAKDGYLTARTSHGLDSELLATFALQLKAALSGILAGTQFKGAWAAKYLHTKMSTPFRQEAEDVMVKVWLQDQRPDRVVYETGAEVYVRRAGSWVAGVITASSSAGANTVRVDGGDEPETFHYADVHPRVADSEKAVMNSVYIPVQTPANLTKEELQEFASTNQQQGKTAVARVGEVVVYSQMPYAHITATPELALGTRPYLGHAVELTLAFSRT